MKTSRHTISFPWLVLCVVNLFLWATQQKKKKTKQWNEDKFFIYFDIERFPCRFVDENQRPSIDICTIRNSPATRHESCPTPQFLFNYEALSCRKVVKTFKPPCEGRKNFDKWMSCLPACLCRGCYLCLEPVSQLLFVSLRLARDVTSSLASPMHTMIVYIDHDAFNCSMTSAYSRVVSLRSCSWSVVIYVRCGMFVQGRQHASSLAHRSQKKKKRVDRWLLIMYAASNNRLTWRNPRAPSAKQALSRVVCSSEFHWHWRFLLASAHEKQSSCA